jgi:hypothetical protein
MPRNNEINQESQDSSRKSNATLATMSNPTIYHMAYSERNVGKTIPENKREVTFDFAVVDEQQHKKDYRVVLKWSFTSGKQNICVNGRENFFFKDGGATVLDREAMTACIST